MDELALESEAGYFEQTRRPLASLAFISPFLAIYLIGTARVFSPKAINGADAMMEVFVGPFFEQWGLRGSVASGAVVVAMLLVWHLGAGYPWRLPWATLTGMLGESVLWGFALLLVFFGKRMAIGGLPWDLVMCCGAGVFEEFLFRLVLVNLAIVCFTIFLHRIARADEGAARFWGSLWGIVVPAAIFSACHYLGPVGEAIDWQSFVFRFVAGLYFSALYFFRGFGIAVGAHVFYDVYVTILASK